MDEPGTSLIMNHADHIDLLRDGVSLGGLWADMGSGSGAFTLALVDLLGSTGQVHSIDKDRAALRQQKKAMNARFPETAVTYHVADYTKQLALPSLDGIVIANSLHFHHGQKRERVIDLIRSYLRDGGRLILVEYDTDQGNRWVPYPISFLTWQRLTAEAGLMNTRLLATKPSRFL